MLRALLTATAILPAGGLLAAGSSDPAAAAAAAEYRALFAEVDRLFEEIPFAEEVVSAPGDPEGPASFHPARRRQVLEALGPAMARLPELARRERVEWGFHEEVREHGFAASAPHIGAGMRLMRTAQWYGRETFADDPQAALDLLVSSAATARHFGSEPVLISYLTQTAGEGLVIDSIAELAPQMSDRQRSELLAIDALLPRGGTLLEAVAMERALMVGYIRKTIEEKTREWKQSLGPGEIAAFPGDLRLAGIRQTGREYPAINLENVRSGANFWLTRGRTLHGIRIVRVDLDAGRAWIRKDDRVALVDLERETLEDRYVPWEVIEAVFDPEVFALVGIPGREGLEAAGVTPANVLDLIDDVDRLYLEFIDALEHSPGAVAGKKDDWGKQIEGNPLARVLVPSLHPILGAEIRHRRRLEAAGLGLEILNGDADPEALSRHGNRYRYQPGENGFDIVAVFEREDEPGYQKDPVTVRFGPPEPAADPALSTGAEAGDPAD